MENNPKTNMVANGVNITKLAIVMPGLASAS